MFWFVIVCLLGLGFTGCAAAAFVKANDAKGITAAAGAVCLVLALLIEIVTGLKSVPVKNIGVPLAFGSVQGGYFRSGIHETWEPWLSVTDVNETVQTTTFEDGGQDNPQSGQCDGGLAVRIGGQQIACADVTIQWEILPGAAGVLFQDYANQGDLMTDVTNAVVVRELKQVVNGVVGDYNPITDVQQIAGSNSATSQFTGFGPTILSSMRADIGSQIYVKSVLFPLMRYDSATQSKLDSIQQTYASYQIAQEQILVNQEQSKAYAKLGTPSVTQLVSTCLSYMDDLIKAGRTPPAGMCNLSGSFSAIAGG